MTDANVTEKMSRSFFDGPRTKIYTTLAGVKMGIERVFNPLLGIGGAYGAWGESYDNQALPGLVEARLGEPLPESERLSLGDLGFTGRHHVTGLSTDENRQLEIEVGARFLQEAARACGWEPAEVQGVLIGVSAPVSEDYTASIAHAAGIPDSALKVSVHKACDSSVGGLHLALNPGLKENERLPVNLARELYGKKILVGGIEGLSRFVESTKDANALQLFGNGAGVIGVIPGQTMKFLVGKSYNVFDEEGVLQVHMSYPHMPRGADSTSLVEVSEVANDHFRVAGLMHEPEDGSNVKMAGPMGMVKLFVRSGVQVVQDVYKAYQDRLTEMGATGKSIATAIVHHANYKINKLKEKNLQKEGIVLPMPWLVSDFGNVSAASNMIAFLRQLPLLNPGDHVMMDGFGAGTYYDTLVFEVQ
jgi:3-oxoacyl-[acyl-carrier-protein] synthase III